MNEEEASTHMPGDHISPERGRPPVSTSEDAGVVESTADKSHSREVETSQHCGVSSDDDGTDKKPDSEGNADRKELDDQGGHNRAEKHFGDGNMAQVSGDTSDEQSSGGVELDRHHDTMAPVPPRSFSSVSSADPEAKTSGAFSEKSKQRRREIPETSSDGEGWQDYLRQVRVDA